VIRVGYSRLASSLNEHGITPADAVTRYTRGWQAEARRAESPGGRLACLPSEALALRAAALLLLLHSAPLTHPVLHPHLLPPSLHIDMDTVLAATADYDHHGGRRK